MNLYCQGYGELISYERGRGFSSKEEAWEGLPQGIGSGVQSTQELLLRVRSAARYQCHLAPWWWRFRGQHPRYKTQYPGSWPAQNPERVVEGFTEEFEEGFMELLRRSHPHSRVAAKIVYNDYISDPCASRLPSAPSLWHCGCEAQWFAGIWYSGLKV